MEEYITTNTGGEQFNSEDPSDEDDHLKLKATIEAILVNTLDQQNDKPEGEQTSPLKFNGFEDIISPPEPSSNSAGSNSFTQIHNQESSVKEIGKRHEMSEFDKLLATVQKEISSSSPSQGIKAAFPVTESVYSTQRISNNEFAHEASPIRESEGIGKQKKLRDVNESKKLPLKKRGRPVGSGSRSRSQKPPVSTSTSFSRRHVEKPVLMSHSRRSVAQNTSVPQKTPEPPSSSYSQKPSKSISSSNSQIAASVPHTENTNSDVVGVDAVEFHLPFGWLFYAMKRSTGSNAGKFDQYYMTPQPRRHKLRSRQEILAWMKSRNKVLDINQFFYKQAHIEPLIKKGILKYITDRCVVAACCENDFFAEERHVLLEKGLLSKIKAKANLENSQKPKEIRKPKEIPKSIPSKVPSKPIPSLRRSGVSTRLSSPNKAHLGTRSFIPEEKFDDENHHTVSKPLVSKSPPPSSIGTEENRVKIRKTPKIFRSPYFSLNDGLPEKPLSIAALCRDRNDKDAPPRSPFNLIQEDLFHNPWQLLVSTIFLNCTSGKLAIPLATEFLSRWSTPQEVCRANIHDILDVVEPLGFGRTRAAQLIRFSHEFLTKSWTYPNELYGIGKYGNDSYKIFCLQNEWKRVDTDDPLLMMYLNWRHATEHLRRKFLSSPGNPLDTDPDDIIIPQEEKNVKDLRITRKSDSPSRIKTIPAKRPASNMRGRKRHRKI